jgi:hypothetical protein
MMSLVIAALACAGRLSLFAVVASLSPAGEIHWKAAIQFMLNIPYSRRINELDLPVRRFPVYAYLTACGTTSERYILSYVSNISFSKCDVADRHKVSLLINCLVSIHGGQDLKRGVKTTHAHLVDYSSRASTATKAKNILDLANHLLDSAIGK